MQSMEHPETSKTKQISVLKIKKLKQSQKLLKSKSHTIEKRPPQKFYQRQNDVYVSNKSNFAALLKKCQKIISSEVGEVYLHSLGIAIPRCIDLALTLVRQSNNGFDYEATTSSKTLVDDFDPLNDDEDIEIQKRINSCLLVRIFRRSRNIPKST